MGFASRKGRKPRHRSRVSPISRNVGLSFGGERSWNVVRHSSALRLDTTLANQQEWMRTRQRFAIPIDAEFPLERSWPSVEVILQVPKTPDNPYGVAWTYAHAPMAFFNGVRR